MTPAEHLALPSEPDDPDAIRRRGAELFHRWLFSHLPAGMTLPAVFPDDGLLDKVTDWGDVSERETGWREPNPSFLAVVGLDDRDWWVQEPISADARMQVIAKQEAKRKAMKDRRSDKAAESIPDWYPKLWPDTIVKIEAAEAAHRRITAERIAEAYFRLAYNRRQLDRDDAAAALDYLSQYGSQEQRIRDAASIIIDRTRRLGASCPPVLFDFIAPRRGRTKNIRDAFIGAARIVIERELPIVSGTGQVDDGATVIAEVFDVSPETVARAGIKYRHDREFSPD